MDLSKLTLEIFSKLERKWLSSDIWSSPPPIIGGDSITKNNKTRILSIDGGFGPEGLVASTALVHLESLLQSHASNPSARIPDFFDLVAGTGFGGILAVLITASSSTQGEGRPLYSAAEAADLLFSNLPALFRPSSFLFRRGSGKERFSGKSLESFLRGALKGLTLKDACKPLLIPCYDLSSSAPFVFSRADATESPCFDFDLWGVCRATSATPGLFRPFRLRSIDGRTACEAVDGGIVMNNPSASAVTHALHNKRDFPGVAGVEDLVVLSLGNGQPVGGGRRSDGEGECTVMEIVMRGASDTVDQILANAFCWNRTDYVRIQANGLVAEKMTEEKETKKKKKNKIRNSSSSTSSSSSMKVMMKRAGERMMREKGVEALPLGGKRLLAETNGERIESLVRRLVLAESSVIADNDTGKPLLLLPAPEPRDSPMDAVTPLADER